MRKVININSGWEFVREGLTENVDLPHTWNGIDGQGGADSYYRGKCVYRRMLPECEGRSFVEVTGANRPIFPGRFQPSIFGTVELNYRVRDGNGWTLNVINTD